MFTYERKQVNKQTKLSGEDENEKEKEHQILCCTAKTYECSMIKMYDTEREKERDREKANG